MNTQVRQGETRKPLGAWLAEHGPLNQQELAGFLRELALQLVALHDQGRIHANLVASEIGITDAGRPRLIAAASELPDFLELPPELAPPEIRSQLAGKLPRSLAAASQALSVEGAAFDARRIDVYQLGALAVQLAAGVSALDYLQSPRAAAKIPAALRRVVDRALGISPAQRLATCTQLLAELDVEYAIVPAVQIEARETPSRGVAISSDTDVLKKQREQARRQRETGELPFERLGIYEIVARLGSGGMGDVFKGYDASLDRFVAIKVLPREFAQQEEFVGRFRAEAAAAAKVEHPNIVPIYTIGSEQDRHFFAMQFVDGQTLGQLLAQQPRLAPEQTLKIVEQVVSGLAAAHRFGLVHRDIKPGNILLADGGRRALVADFGLVKSIGQSNQMTATGVVMGTVDYISPEQGRGKTVDGRSDLYSIGVLFYQMLAGKLPFSADTPTAMIFQHAYEPPPPLLEASPQTPPVLAQIVHRLLAKAPAERYQTCEDLLDDLVAFRCGQAPPHLSGTAAARETGPRTAIILAPKFVEHDLPPEPETEPAIVPAKRWSWEYAKQYVFFWLKQKAPELVRRLENTQQQVDGAVFEYEQRCESLGRLVSEAQAVQRLLEIQLKEHTAAASIARKRKGIAQDDESLEEATAQCVSNESAAAQLQQQVLQQREELEAMQLEFAKASARLTNLRSQRDALQARLKVAQARYGLSDSRKRPKWQNPYLIGGAAAIAIAAPVIYFGFIRSTPNSSANPPPNPSPITSPSSDANTAAKGSEAGAYKSVTLPVAENGKFSVNNQVYSGTQVTLPVKPTDMRFFEETFDTHARIMVAGEDGNFCELTVTQRRIELRARLITAHQSQINSLAYHRVTNRLASASKDGEVIVWDLRANRSVYRRLQVGGEALAVSFSPDGSQLLTGSHAGARLWDLSTGNELQRYVEPERNTGAQALAWLPDGSGFVQGENVRGAPGTFIANIDGDKWKTIYGSARRDLAVINAGQQIAGVQNSELGIWNIIDGKSHSYIGTGVTCAAYSQQQRRVLTGHRDGTVTLWELPSGKKVQEFKIGGRVELVAISDRSVFGLAVSGKELHLLALPPEVISYRRMQKELSAHVKALAVSPERFDVLVAGDQIARRYPLEGVYGTSEIQGAGPSSAIALSPDGNRFLLARSLPDRLGFGTITLRDRPKTAIASDTTIRRFQGHKGGTTAAVFGRNATRIISGGLDNHVRVWETSTEQELSAIDVSGPVAALATSADAKRAVVATDKVNCDIWNLDDKTHLGTLSGHALPPRSVVWAKRASRVATASGDRTARVWDPQSFTLVASFDHPSPVTTVELTTDGKWMITGSEDGFLRVWDVERKQAAKAWWAHQGAVTALAMGLDDKTLVSAGTDLTLSWWDLPTN